MEEGHQERQAWRRPSGEASLEKVIRRGKPGEGHQEKQAVRRPSGEGRRKSIEKYLWSRTAIDDRINIRDCIPGRKGNRQGFVCLHLYRNSRKTADYDNVIC